MKSTLYLSVFTFLLGALSAFVGCSTVAPQAGDPPDVRRTSRYCLEADPVAKFFVCNTGTMGCISINGGLMCSPNPAPSVSPSPAPKAK